MMRLVRGLRFPSGAAMRHIVTHKPDGHPRYERQVSSCPVCCDKWIAEFHGLSGRLEWVKML
jgi:hypothetical protein